MQANWLAHPMRQRVLHQMPPMPPLPEAVLQLPHAASVSQEARSGSNSGSLTAPAAHSTWPANSSTQAEAHKVAVLPPAARPQRAVPHSSHPMSTAAAAVGQSIQVSCRSACQQPSTLADITTM
jgi:hypothetical protein